MEEPSDAQLLERWRAGDGPAGEALIRRHYGSVLRYFELNASWAADDLTQRTFMACVERADQVRDVSAFRAYVMGIARRQLAMHLRALSRRAPGDELAEPPQTTRLSTLVARNSEQLLALRALASLPREPQLLLVLFYWEQIEGPQLAAEQGVTPSTIRTRLARARALLRARMEAFAGRTMAGEDDEGQVERVLSSVLASHADAVASLTGRLRR